MATLPVDADTKRVIRAFGKLGYESVRQKGSHETLRRPDTPDIITVVHPRMRIGTLRRCVRKAGVTVDEFCRFYDEA